MTFKLNDWHHLVYRRRLLDFEDGLGTIPDDPGEETSVSSTIA